MILKVKGDWQEVVDDCRETVGRPPLGKEPSEAFKKSILIAEHSPIRDISIKWIWHDIKSWVATHWVRHKWECFVRTQRDDRTGEPRDDKPQGALVDFTGEANAQALIDTMRKRLCYMAHRETRGYANALKAELYSVEPEISDVLVPNCVYRCGCPEPNGCHKFAALCLDHPNMLSTDICQRYEVFNECFASGEWDSAVEYDRHK